MPQKFSNGESMFSVRTKLNSNADELGDHLKDPNAHSDEFEGLANFIGLQMSDVKDDIGLLDGRILALEETPALTSVKAEDVSYDNSKVKELNATQAQDAFDELAVDLYANAFKEIDMTNMPYEATSPRPDLWHIKLDAPLIGNYAMEYHYYDTPSQNEANRELMATLYIIGKQVWFEYGDKGSGDIVYLTNPDNTPVTALTDSAYFPLTRQFADNPLILGLSGMVVWYLGESVDLFEPDDNFKSLMWVNVRVLDDKVGLLSNLNTINKASVVGAVNEVLAFSLSNLAPIVDRNNDIPDISLGQLMQLGITAKGIYRKELVTGIGAEGFMAVCPENPMLEGMWYDMGPVQFPVTSGGLFTYNTHFWVHESNTMVLIRGWEEGFGVWFINDINTPTADYHNFITGCWYYGELDNLLSNDPTIVPNVLPQNWNTEVPGFPQVNVHGITWTYIPGTSVEQEWVPILLIGG